MYSTEEKIQILQWYQAGSSMRIVRDLFSIQYPTRPIPSLATIWNIIKNFNARGCVVNSHHQRNRRCHILTEEMKLNVLCYAEEEPISTITQMSNYFGISRFSIRKVLKECRFKPYKFRNHQYLTEEDKIRRTDFCELMFNSLNTNEQLLENIMFTDEASFSRNGEVNSQNYRSDFLQFYYSMLFMPKCSYYRYWARTNPHVQNLIRHQVQERLNVWAGLINNRLIGPFFIDGNLNANKFLRLLRDHIIPEIEPLNIENIWFQMDGAPAHSCRIVTNYLNDVFGERWIGRFGPVAWPARSPDLSPNDFFLWGHLHNTIYDHVEIQTIQELQERIVRACQELNPNFVRNAVQGFHHRLGYCLEQGGGHFEYLL